MSTQDPPRTRQLVLFELERAEKALSRAKADEKRAVEAVRQLEGGVRALFAKLTGGHQEQLERAVERAETAIDTRQAAAERVRHLADEAESLGPATADAPHQPATAAPLALNQAKKSLQRAADTRQALLDGTQPDWASLHLSVADLRALSPQAGVPALPSREAPDVAARLADWIAEVEVVAGMLEADSEDAAALLAASGVDGNQAALARAAVHHTQELLHAIEAGRFRNTKSRPPLVGMSRRGARQRVAVTRFNQQVVSEFTTMQGSAETAVATLFATLVDPPPRPLLVTSNYTLDVSEVSLQATRKAARETLDLILERFPDAQ